MPDKIVAMNFSERETAIVGMTKEQYALLNWLSKNHALRNNFSYAEWDNYGEEIPTDPEKM